MNVQNQTDYFKPSIIKDGRYAGTTNKSVRGAASEAFVSADLLDRGYHVYRAICHASPFDLVMVCATGEMKRVEVKTVQVTLAGNFTMPPCHANQPRAYDILACVKPGGDISYIPPID